MENEKNIPNIFDEDEFFALGQDEVTEEEQPAEESEADETPAEDAPAEKEADADDKDRTDNLEERVNDLEKRVDKNEKATKELGYEEKEEAEDVQKEYAAMEAADLAELQKRYPDIKLNSLRDLKNLGRYGELRDMGLSAAEAFMATNAEMLEKRAEETGAARAASKAHMTTVSKKSGGTNEPHMTDEELAIARDFFPDMSDEQIQKVYKKAYA